MYLIILLICSKWPMASHTYQLSPFSWTPGSFPTSQFALSLFYVFHDRSLNPCLKHTFSVSIPRPSLFILQRWAIPTLPTQHIIPIFQALSLLSLRTFHVLRNSTIPCILHLYTFSLSFWFVSLNKIDEMRSMHKLRCLPQEFTPGQQCLETLLSQS